MKAGDRVIFTGYEYRRAIQYHYADLFGEKEYIVGEVSRSCCNTFLILTGIDGMYSEKFFTKV